MAGLPTVLFGEDDDLVRAMVPRVLKKAGMRVIVAGDGGEAVTLYAANVTDIDVVVLDVRMPVLEGPAALSRMLELKPTQAAILTSGFARANHEIDALLRRGVRFLPKPFRATELAHMIQQLVITPPNAQ